MIFHTFRNWGKLVSAFDNSMSTLELIKCLRKMLDEVHENEVELNEKLNNLITFIEKDGLEKYVVEELIRMEESGELAGIINEQIFAELNSKIDGTLTDVNNQIEDLKSEIDDRVNDGLEKLDDELDSHGLSIIKNKDLVTDGDWSLAIQKTIDEASLTSNTVIIPSGTYTIKQSIILKGGVHLKGVGFSSVLRLADNANIDYMIKTEYRMDSYTYNVMISDLTLDGNRSKNQSRAVGGILIVNGWQSDTSRVKILDVSGDGYTILGRGNSSSFGASTNFLRDSIIVYNDGRGVRVDAEQTPSGGYSLQGDFHCINNDIGSNGLSGVELRRGDANAIRNTVCWMNGQKLQGNLNMVGVAIYPESNINEITDNNLEGNKGAGAFIQSNFNSIIGNRIFANSQEQDYLHYGVNIFEGKGNIIATNKILSGVGVAGQSKGIYNNGTFTEIYNNNIRWNNYGEVNYNYQPVFNTPLAEASVNDNQSYIFTKARAELDSNFVSNALGSEVLFNNRVDSFNELDGTKFYPKFGGFYNASGVIFTNVASATQTTIRVLGVTVFNGLLPAGDFTINFNVNTKMNFGEVRTMVETVGSFNVLSPTNINIKRG